MHPGESFSELDLASQAVRRIGLLYISLEIGKIPTALSTGEVTKSERMKAITIG